MDEFGTDGQGVFYSLEAALAFYEPQSTYKTFFEMWQEKYGE